MQKEKKGESYKIEIGIHMFLHLSRKIFYNVRECFPYPGTWKLCCENSCSSLTMVYGILKGAVFLNQKFNELFSFILPFTCKDLKIVNRMTVPMWFYICQLNNKTKNGKHFSINAISEDKNRLSVLEPSKKKRTKITYKEWFTYNALSCWQFK